MKLFTKYLVLIVLALTYNVTAQVINDDCYNAIDLGTFIGSNNCSTICFDASLGHDTVVSGSNQNAIPNYPYYTMQGCQGYTTATIPSNDVWYKLKSGDFKIDIMPTTTSLDSIHLSVWYGSNCNTISPSGCYTFDYSNISNSRTYTFAGDSTFTDEIYLQFSGNRISKTGSFQFCIAKALPLPNPIIYFGTTTIVTNIIKNKNNQETINFFPNPTSGLLNFDYQTLNEYQLNITNTIGKTISKLYINNNQSFIDICQFENGIYFLQLYKGNQLVGTKKIIKQ